LLAHFRLEPVVLQFGQGKPRPMFQRTSCLKINAHAIPTERLCLNRLSHVTEYVFLNICFWIAVSEYEFLFQSICCLKKTFGQNVADHPRALHGICEFPIVTGGETRRNPRETRHANMCEPHKSL
jgi:hypothetical protein